MDNIKQSKTIVDKMTLQEKANMCVGSSFWLGPENKAFGLRAHLLTDGPHGLRKQEAGADHLGINQSIPAVCFPTAVASACSFDRDLLKRMGNALGEKCIREDVSVILGPGINMKRNPLCGRNFEYFSEDPYLAGEMGSALVQGIQEKGIGVSVKHFAVNSQETNRMVIDSVVDKRAVEEIYLEAFRKVVKQAKPWTVMCSYNKINGVYANTNKWLLTDKLRKDWGYDGLVVSDWGAVSDRVEGIKAGMDLEMPGCGQDSADGIVKAVKTGKLSEDAVNICAERNVELILKMQQEKVKSNRTDAMDHELAEEIAAKSAVLLKNENHILPLHKDTKIALIGQMAEKPRYQGAGSSKINAFKVEDAKKSALDKGLEISYYDGYDLNSKEVNQKFIEEAAAGAGKAEVAIIFAGLPDEYESEGFDRTDMDMPESHLRLIEEVTLANPNVIVVLQCGSPVELPFKDKVKGILLMYLSGEAGGRAIIDILTGEVNPSGKLAETWPISLRDVPGGSFFPGKEKAVELRESIYIGYRYYDTAGCDVAYPFGYGLSYTDFSYEGLKVNETEAYQYDICVNIKNVGKLAGDEIVQLYIGRKDNGIVFRAAKELKAFEKVHLESGESKDIAFHLCKNDFQYYNEKCDEWCLEKGTYKIMTGCPGKGVMKEETVILEGDGKEELLEDTMQQLTEYRKPAIPFAPSSQQFQCLLGYEPPSGERIPGEKFTLNSTMGDIRNTKIGKTMLKKAGSKMSQYENDPSMMRMVNAMMYSTPIRAMRMTGGMSLKQAQGIVDMANGHYLRGILKMK